MTLHLDVNLSLLRDPALAARLRAARPGEQTPSPPAPAVDKTKDCLLVGLGPAAVQIALQIDSKRWLAVVEPKEDVARAAFERIDLAPFLARERSRLFVGTDRIAFLQWLREFLNASEADDLTLVSVGAIPWIEAEVRAAVNRRAVEVRTLVEYSEQIDANLIANLPWRVRSAGVKSFEGLGRGCAAVVVGAGPSLTEDLDAIRGSRGVVIAVGKALKLLLDRGIVPPFVANIDMTASIKPCFEGFAIPPDVALLWDPDSHPDVVASFPGERVTFDTPTPLVQWGKPFWGEKGAFEKGLTVAHAAFQFARLLGCDPIILSGIDLAFPGDRTHAEGVTMTWGGAVDPANPNLIEIPSVTGAKVRSTQAFLSFVSAFEVEIARTKARVIHTSRGGALIRGTERAPVPTGLPGTAPSFGDAFGAPRPFDKTAFAAASERVLKAAPRVIERAESGERMLKQTAKLDRTNRLDEAEFRKLAARINEARTGIEGESEFAPLVQRLLAREALEMRELTRQFAAAADLRESTAIDLRRMEIFFRGYARAARAFADRFGPVREMLIR